MKHILALIFICLLALPAYSQSIVQRQITVGCLENSAVNKMLEKEGWLLQELYFDPYSNFIVQLFERERSDKYSIVLRYPTGYGCLLLLGDDKVEVNEQPNTIPY